jgi:tartrate dehydratase beta subunit/fumarate hydratase class I family protein
LEALSGLNEGDMVVINGQINLMDGAKVSIIKNRTENEYANHLASN